MQRPKWRPGALRRSVALRPRLPLVGAELLKGVLPHRVFPHALPAVQLVQIQAPDVVCRGERAGDRKGRCLEVHGARPRVVPGPQPSSAGCLGTAVTVPPAGKHHAVVHHSPSTISVCEISTWPPSIHSVLRSTHSMGAARARGCSTQGGGRGAAGRQDVGATAGKDGWPMRHCASAASAGQSQHARPGHDLSINAPQPRPRNPATPCTPLRTAATPTAAAPTV